MRLLFPSVGGQVVADGRRGTHGEVWKQDAETGARVGSYPGHGTAFVEGRLRALLNGREDHGLAPPSALPSGASVAAGLLQREGFEVGAEDALVRRCDLAGDIEFEDGRDGAALLNGFAALDIPWAKTGTEGGKGLALETVIHRNTRGRRIQSRLYDKATESGVGERGTRVRFERQGHYRNARQFAVGRFVGLDHAAVMVGTVDRYLATGVVHVCTPTGATERVCELLDAGEVTARRGASLLGELTLYGVYGGSLWSRSAYYRRSADWRRLGLAVVDPARVVDELPNVVPLADYFGRVRERWAA